VSTDSGTNWTAAGIGAFAFFRLEYSGSVFSGIPLENIALDATNAVYSTREVGSVWTSPVVGLKVRGIQFALTKVGTPTGNPRGGIKLGSSGTLTDLGYTALTIPAAAISTAAASLETLLFNSSVTIPANSTVRVSLGETAQSDSSSNKFELNVVSVHNDANSAALMPLGGSALKQTYCTGTCTTASNWTAGTAVWSPFILILDPAGEFVPGGGGASTYVAQLNLFHHPLEQARFWVPQ